MQQYYYKKELEKNVEITGETFRYLKKVIRIKPGEQIYLFDGQKKSSYEIDEVSDVIKATKIKDIEKKIELNISLGIGLLKRDKLEWVIQKATELGCRKINLMKLENNVVKIDKKIEKKLARYKEISLNAILQSKRDSLVSIEYIDELDLENYDFVYVAHEKHKTNTLYKELINCKKENNIIILVGPEGGFSENEINKFEKNKNVKIVSLGTNILRAETAAITAIGLANSVIE